MKYYMCGLDRSNPDLCAQDLKARGFDAVVLFGAPAEHYEACRKHDLEVWTGIGAFWVQSAPADEEHLAQDIYGTPRRWFGSGCPNDPELLARHINETVEVIKKYHPAYIMLDGCRFASPASQEGFASFFTCFCPHCQAKAKELGFDLDAIKASVQRWKDCLEGKGGDPVELWNAASDWLRFRQACMDELFAAFRDAVEEADPNCKCGAFVFTGSLCHMVGQSEAALSHLALAAPMIYRHYQHPTGPACMDHEWAALMRAFAPVLDEDDRRAFAKSYGADLCSLDADTLIRDGMPVRAVEDESRLSRSIIPAEIPSMPIVQLDDPDLLATITAIHDSGAQGCGFFDYKEEFIHYLPELPFLDK